MIWNLITNVTIRLFFVVVVRLIVLCFFFKGVILQICELQRRINSLENEGEILERISQLTKVDPLRKGYYTYLGKLNIIKTSSRLLLSS